MITDPFQILFRGGGPLDSTNIASCGAVPTEWHCPMPDAYAFRLTVDSPSIVRTLRTGRYSLEGCYRLEGQSFKPRPDACVFLWTGIIGEPSSLVVTPTAEQIQDWFRGYIFQPN